MRVVAFGLVLSAIFVSTVSYSREYKSEVSRSFPELPNLNKEVAPGLSQEAFHTHWCLQTYEAELAFEYRISKGQRGLSESAVTTYLHWYALWSRNPITDEQKRAIRQKVEDVYGLGPDKTGYVFRSNHQAAACFPNYYPISLDEWRLKGSVPGLSQKAFHAHWCHEAYTANYIIHYLATGQRNSDLEDLHHWESVSKQYPVTPEQLGALKTQLYEFYNFGPDKIPTFITYVHQSLHCNYKPGHGFYDLGIELFNTAKE